MIKRLIIISLTFNLSFIDKISARALEVDVHGMTCAFCVDSLQREFSKIKSVSKVDVSLKLKKIRLETDEQEPSFELIKQTVLNSGFTPINIRVLTDEPTQD